MRKAIFTQVFFLMSLLFIFSKKILAQDCVVEKESLKGTYSGDCKKGKANGNGKAVGIDTYEGEFKSGLPDGEGTYAWKNGNIYTGHFTKGMMDGKGHLLFKRVNTTDSIVDGYWKKDDYIGKYDSPYKVYFKSSSISKIEIDYKKDNFNQLTFYVSSASAGGSTINGNIPNAKVDDIQLVSGSIGRITTNNGGSKKTQSIVNNIIFPARMKVVIGRENFEVEFREPGTYTIDVTVN